VGLGLFFAIVIIGGGMISRAMQKCPAKIHPGMSLDELIKQSHATYPCDSNISDMLHVGGFVLIFVFVFSLLGSILNWNKMEKLYQIQKSKEP
jgi:hypothetical protein